MGHYLQRVTPGVALGAELVYQRGPRVPGGEIAVLSLASKITGKEYLDCYVNDHKESFLKSHCDSVC